MQHLPNLILIASEQVWPNLHALLHWCTKADGLDRIIILHTEAPQSQLPAQRLQDVLTRSRGEPFRFHHVELSAIGTAADDVSRRIQELCDKYGDQQWIVVANGGLKTMTLGLLPAMADQQNFQVVYSEFGGNWQRVILQPDRTIGVQPLTELRPEDMDQLPVESLIRAQHIGREESFELSLESIEPIDVRKVSSRCMSQTPAGTPIWDWTAGFGLPGSRSGPLFEKWFAGLLLKLRVTNIVSGLEVIAANGGQAASESDLLAIHKGRFFYIELKLRDENAEQDGGQATLIQILRKATELTRTFAGFGGVPLVVLPNWRLTEGQRDLVRLFSPAPQILDASESGRLISWVAKQMGIDPIPTELRELEQEAQNWMQVHGLSRVFAREPSAIRRARDPRHPVIVSLPALANAYRQECGQNWFLWEHGGKLHFSIPRIPEQAPPEGFKRMNEFWRAECRCTPELKRDIQKRFSPLVGKNPQHAELIKLWHALVAPLQASSQLPRTGQQQPTRREDTRATTPPPNAQGVIARNRKAVQRRKVLHGKGWQLEQHIKTGQYQLTIGAKKTAGLSNKDFPEAVKRVVVEQKEPGAPRNRRILFVQELPLPVILAEFKGGPYDGKGMADAIRNWLKAQTGDGKHAG